MPISESTMPITEDDETLAALLCDVELPALLPALAYLTSDMALVAPELRGAPRMEGAALAPQGGMSSEAQEAARQLAFEALRKLRDCPRTEAAEPAPDVLRTLMHFITGDTADDYEPLLIQELGLGSRLDADEIGASPVGRRGDFLVAVVGAGMSGLVAAYTLARAGLPFVVLERNADVGGVWLENDYPGCRLDTNNFAYSFSFAQTNDWAQQYSPRAAIHKYFRDFADEHLLRPHIRFGTEVVGAAFDETSCAWTLRLRDRDGNESFLEAQAVISAVGQLNKPSYPPISGRDRFAGTSFHTARWNHDIDLTGRRVAVIGTGASGYQVIPAIAGRVSQLLVFQRSAPWALPAPTYHEDLSPGLRWFFHHVPHYHRWFRFYQFWAAVEGMRPYAAVDPEWTKPGSVSARNESLRQALVEHIEAQYVDRPDLVKKVVPDYPPYAKRMLRDNGDWANTLKRDHVKLITDPIVEITEHGLRTSDGVEHDVDVIIYATGFSASQFLSSMVITGRQGVELHEQWAGDARAFLGITIPNFPNFFCLYGPNTNLVLNGSIIMFSELAMQHALACIEMVIAGGHRAIECRREPFESYNRRIDAQNKCMAWGLPTVRNWYKNAFGRVSQNWPLSTFDYWSLTREPSHHDYQFL